MAGAQNPRLETAIAGALEWWRDAGVDCAYADEPTIWLTPAEAEAADPSPEVPTQRKVRPEPKAEPAPPPVPQIDPASIPSRLDAFVGWWMSEPLLADGSTERRVMPRGSAGSELMVIVPEPEREDVERLLSGPQGRLLEAMLAAFGISLDQVYFASVLPRHLPGADWDETAASGMGQILAKHVELAAPKRLAVFGSGILPLLSHDPPQGAADLRIFNHEGGTIPMLACRSLAALLEQPRWKAKVWQRWLEMTG
ncbi:MAG: hypothetical protein KDE32_14460 [Novosphingobium sp.]|nr:hypothetical protein [Novosphingobium sp.]